MPSASGLYYFAHGAENPTRPPVVLIHGAGGNHLYWPPQLRRLPGERVFAVDLPGHGKSPGVGHQTIEDYAAEVIGFIEALKLHRAVLVGHSMGGAVALRAAIDAPGRALALGLLGSAAGMHVSPKLLQMAADPSNAADTAHWVTEKSFAEGTSPRLKELAEQRMGQTRSSVLYGDLLACDAFDPGMRAAEIAAPALIVFGREDRMMPASAGRLLMEQMQHARLELVDGAGHMVMLEQPDRVAELMSAFLRSVPYQPGE